MESSQVKRYTDQQIKTGWYWNTTRLLTASIHPFKVSQLNWTYSNIFKCRWKVRNFRNGCDNCHIDTNSCSRRVWTVLVVLHFYFTAQINGSQNREGFHLFFFGFYELLGENWTKCRYQKMGRRNVQWSTWNEKIFIKFYEMRFCGDWFQKLLEGRF